MVCPMCFAAAIAANATGIAAALSGAAAVKLAMANRSKAAQQMASPSHDDGDGLPARGRPAAPVPRKHGRSAMPPAQPARTEHTEW